LIYFELPNGKYVFETLAAWNIFYEHCSYVSPDLLLRLFTASGCLVLKSGPCFEEGQYLNLVAGVGESAPASVAPQTQERGLSLHLLKQFGQQYAERVSTKRAELDALRAAGRRVVAWGSGGRGVSFVNSMAAGSGGSSAAGIEYVVDINPERQEKYVPGSGQRIIAPAELQQVQPDIIVLTNPTYRAEIEQMVAAFGLNPEYIEA
jgi:hypothetical protein